MPFEADFSPQTLAAVAGLDPWKLRDKLTAGNPGEIGTLAAAFATASGDHQQAATLKRRAQSYTGAGYQKDDTPIRAPEQHADQVRRSLHGGSTKLSQIATSLNGIATALHQNASQASRRIQQLDADVLATVRRYNRDVATATSGLTDPVEVEREQRRIYGIRKTEAAASVRQAAGTIGPLVKAYEAKLQAGQRTLSNLGYVPPAAVSSGGGELANTPGARGARDGAALSAAVNGNVDRNSYANYVRTNAEANRINQKLAAGGKLTAGERAYLTAYHNALGKSLAKIPAFVDKATRASFPPGQNGAPSDAKKYQAFLNEKRVAATRPVANNILNLYNPDKGGYDRLTNTERDRAVWDLVHQRAGYRDPATGVVYPNQYAKFGGAAPQDGVDGAEEYAGFAALLKSSDPRVTAGDQFTGELAAGAVNFKKDIDAVRDTLPPNSYELGGAQFRELLSDQPASDVLSVASHNKSASANILIDDALRREILGQDWSHDDGAAALVSSGTALVPDAPNSELARRHAQAALAVIEDAGTHRIAYFNSMGDDLKASVVRTGEQYIEAFGDDDANTGVLRDRDALNRALGWGLDLDATDRKSFLNFVAGSGYGAEFKAVAVNYDQRLLADAFASGDEGAINDALTDSGRRQGAIREGYVQRFAEQAGGKANDDNTQAYATYRATVLENQGTRAAIALGAAAPAAAAGLVLGPGGAAAAGVGAAVVSYFASAGIVDPPPPTQQNVAEVQRQAAEGSYDRGAPEARLTRNAIVLLASRDAGIDIDYGDPDVRAVLESPAPQAQQPPPPVHDAQQAGVERQIRDSSLPDDVLDRYDKGRQQRNPVR